MNVHYTVFCLFPSIINRPGVAEAVIQQACCADFRSMQLH